MDFTHLCILQTNPSIEYVGGRWCHTFHCAGRSCKQKIHPFLDKGDAGSTSNLRKHAISCLGEPSVKAVMDCANMKNACQSVDEIKHTRSITAAFERKGKGKITYSHRQHSKTETKYVPTLAVNSKSHVFTGQRLFVGYLRVFGHLLLLKTKVSSPLWKLDIQNTVYLFGQPYCAMLSWYLQMCVNVWKNGCRYVATTCKMKLVTKGYCALGIWREIKFRDRCMDIT